MVYGSDIPKLNSGGAPGSGHARWLVRPGREGRAAARARRMESVARSVEYYKDAKAGKISFTTFQSPENVAQNTRTTSKAEDGVNKVITEHNESKVRWQNMQREGWVKRPGIDWTGRATMDKTVIPKGAGLEPMGTDPSKKQPWKHAIWNSAEGLTLSRDQFGHVISHQTHGPGFFTVGKRDSGIPEKNALGLDRTTSAMTVERLHHEVESHEHDLNEARIQGRMPTEKYPGEFAKTGKRTGPVQGRPVQKHHLELMEAVLKDKRAEAAKHFDAHAEAWGSPEALHHAEQGAARFHGNLLDKRKAEIEAYEKEQGEKRVINNMPKMTWNHDHNNAAEFLWNLHSRGEEPTPEEVAALHQHRERVSQYDEVDGHPPGYHWGQVQQAVQRRWDAHVAEQRGRTPDQADNLNDFWNRAGRSWPVGGSPTPDNPAGLSRGDHADWLSQVVLLHEYRDAKAKERLAADPKARVQAGVKAAEALRNHVYEEHVQLFGQASADHAVAMAKSFHENLQKAPNNNRLDQKIGRHFHKQPFAPGDARAVPAAPSAQTSTGSEEPDNEPVFRQPSDQQLGYTPISRMNEEEHRNWIASAYHHLHLLQSQHMERLFPNGIDRAPVIRNSHDFGHFERMMIAQHTIQKMEDEFQAKYGRASGARSVFQGQVARGQGPRHRVDSSGKFWKHHAEPDGTIHRLYRLIRQNRHRLLNGIQDHEDYFVGEEADRFFNNVPDEPRPGPSLPGDDYRNPPPGTPPAPGGPA